MAPRAFSKRYTALAASLALACELVAAQDASYQQALHDLHQKARPVTVRDFALDGKTLAANLSPVRTSGIYLLQGRTEFLYENPTAAAEAQACDECGRILDIPLLTSDAPRDFREQLLECQEDPAKSQMGCLVTIYGLAVTCTVTNVFGATTETPCVEVLDGAVIR